MIPLPRTQSHKVTKSQSFGLTSTQGAFIGIAYHRKTLGYCITDGTKVSCTRHHIAFDPYLYPFTLNATAPPAWQTFHNLTTPKPQAAITDFEVPQMNTDLPHTEELADNSEESDFDPERTSSGKHVNGNRRPPAGTNGFRKRRRTNDASTSSSAHSQHPGTEGTSSTSDLQGAGKTDCLPALQQ